MEKMLQERGGKLGAMDQRYCIDNGAMIAYTGSIMYQSGIDMDSEDCYIT